MTDQIHGDVFHFEDLLPELQYEIVKRMSPVEQIKFERTSQNSKELVQSSFWMINRVTKSDFFKFDLINQPYRYIKYTLKMDLK